MEYIKNQKAFFSLGAVAAVSVIWMSFTGTLAYPYIMISRQIQMIEYCELGSNRFTTTEFGFNVTIPDKYCFLPNRIFPHDGSINVLPKGAYFVINEYARGTVIRESKSVLLFEPLIPGRNTKDVMQALRLGKFLEEAIETDLVNKNGLKIHLAKNVRGVDSASHYDWAFIEHPNGRIFLSVLLADTKEPEVFNYMIENISPVDSQDSL